MDTSGLVRAAQAGDREAFAQLVEANQSMVYNLAYRMTLNAETAADLTQETFLTLWRNLGQFRGDSAFSTWLYRLATNTCIDFLRREKHRTAVSLTSPEGGDALSLPDDRWSPHLSLERTERRDAVRRALAALPPHQRQILVLREMEGLSYREIAQLLQLEEGTVKSRIARARLALRDLLLADGNFFPAPPSNEM